MSRADRYTRQALEGRYANSFKVGHSQSEFLLDFGQYYSEFDDVSYFVRIIVSPQHARALLKLLGQSVQQFEEIPERLGDGT